MRYVFYLYLALLIAFRWVIFHQTNHACAGTSEPASAGSSANSIIPQSDRFDQECVSLEGVVVCSGHLWWDVFFISSYTLRTNGGHHLTVFTHAAVPQKGRRLRIAGTFRQFYKGSYFTWLGLVEAERFYHDQPIVPDEPKMFPDVPRDDGHAPPVET